MGLFVEQESHLVPQLALQWIVLISPNNIFSRFLFFLRLFLFCKVFNQYLATITFVELKTLEKTFSLSIEFQDDKFTISIYYREPQMWCLNEILGRENPQKKLFRERESTFHIVVEMFNTVKILCKTLKNLPLPSSHNLELLVKRIISRWKYFGLSNFIWSANYGQNIKWDEKHLSSKRRMTRFQLMLPAWNQKPPHFDVVIEW